MATDPTDNDPVIRHLFPRDAGAPNTLDAASIIRRSRARRLPKRIAAGSITTLAVAGIVVASLQGVANPPETTSMAASDTAAEELAQPKATEVAPNATSPETLSASGSSLEAQKDEAAKSPMSFSSTETQGRFAATVNACGAPLADLSTSTEGLEVSLDFPRTATLDGKSIAGTVTLTNTSASPLKGYADENTVVVLSKNGVVLWYSNGLVSGMPAYLTIPTFTAGDTRDYTTSFWPVTCTAADDNPDTDSNGQKYLRAFGPSLPEVAPGEYQLSALVEFHTGSTTHLITSPLTTITLE